MKQQSLSEFEQQVMDIVWKKEACTIKDVHTSFSKEKSFAYNTIGTILERLYEKGFVHKKNTNGVNLFTPKVSKERYSENIMTTFLRKFMATFGEIGIASFVKSVDKLPQEKRDYFLTLLKKYDKNS